MTDTPDLSQRQAEVRDLLLQRDMSKDELGDELGISGSTVRNHVNKLRSKGYTIDYTYGSNVYTLAETPDGDDTPTAHDTAPDGGSTPDPEPAPATTAPADDEDDDPLADGVPGGIVDDLKRGGLTYADFDSQYGLGRSAAKRAMQELRQQGATVEFKTVDSQGTRMFYMPEEADKRFRVGDGDGVYRFGLMSDTHLGSSAEHLDELHDYYDRLQDRGIDLVFHAGDIGDGWEVHKGHINAIKGEASGWDRLREYVVENYPRRHGIDTLFVEGNHDHKLHRRTGVRFGEQVDRERDDLHYCGDSMARFVFDPEHDIDLELIHPSGGQPYTVGYRLQTLFRERPADSRPTIAGVGHLHGSMYAKTEGVHGFYTGAWKGLTTYGKRKGHEASIGGWIIELEIVDGEVRRLVPEWIGYDAEDTTANFSMQDVADMIGGDD